MYINNTSTICPWVPWSHWWCKKKEKNTIDSICGSISINQILILLIFTVYIKCPQYTCTMVRGLWPLSPGGQPSFITFGLIDILCSHQLLSAYPSLSYAALSQVKRLMRKTLNAIALHVIDLHHHTNSFYSHCFTDIYRFMLPVCSARVYMHLITTW